MIQLAVPDGLRGRVMSVYTTVFAGSVPAGGLLMGAVASAWDVPLAFILGGVLSLAVGVPALFWVGRLRRDGSLRSGMRAPIGVPTGAGPERPLGSGAPTGVGTRRGS
jgi:hypothetical protein